MATNLTQRGRNANLPARLPALPVPPLSAPPELRRWLEGVREWLEVRLGSRGDFYERAVTHRELREEVAAIERTINQDGTVVIPDEILAPLRNQLRGLDLRLQFAQNQWLTNLTAGNTTVQNIANQLRDIDTQDVPYFARDMLPSATGGCSALTVVEFDPSGPNFHALLFDPVTDESADFHAMLPLSWAGKYFRILVYWGHGSGATTFNVRWSFQANSTSDDEPLDLAFVEGIAVDDTGGTAGHLYIGAVSDPIPIASQFNRDGDMVSMRITRLNGGVTDNLDVDAGLLAVRFVLADVVIVPPFVCLDGPVWSSASLAATTIYPLRSVAVGGGFAVAVSNNSGNPYATYSDDAGATWNVSTITGFGASPGGASDPIYTGTAFFAQVNAVTGMRSTDGGQNWAAVSFPSILADNNGYAFGKLYLIGNSNTNGINVSTDDGASFTLVTVGLPTWSGATTNLSASPTVAMFGGLDGTGAYIVKTTDGSTWTRVSAPWGTNGINRIENDGSRFVAIGTAAVNSDAGYYSDDDGATWTSMSLVGTGSGTNRWRDLKRNGGIFIAVSETTTDVSISEDGATWALSANAMLSGGATSIAADGNFYVAQRNASVGTIRVGTCPG